MTMIDMVATQLEFLLLESRCVEIIITVKKSKVEPCFTLNIGQSIEGKISFKTLAIR